YFIPYIKGKGVRDVYGISKIRIGTREGNRPKNDSKDIRLNFELVYLGSLSEKYQKIRLSIWNTFSKVELIEK
ncbi:MAG: site-specific DNA-methyltransferase, partial [Muribaculaceae bacterium]|nr:site-specific DNA-methyltransferase [Muribaculaceae bacterium]